MKLIKTCELTSGQESILFDCLKNLDKRYLIQVILCFDCEINVSKLNQALVALCNQNEVLCSVINMDDYLQPMIEIYDEGRYALCLYEQDREWNACLDHGLCSVDYQNTPVHIGVLIKDGKSKIIVSYHHILFDGWSGTYFIYRMCKYYRLLVENIQLPTVRSPSFYDFSIETKKLNTAKSKCFWVDYLQGCTPSIVGLSEIKEQSCLEELKLRFSLTKNEMEQIVFLLKHEHITVANYLSATWAITLAEHLNTPDVVFGYTYSGRHLGYKDIGQIMGVLFTCLPLRVVVTKHKFWDLFRKVQELSLSVMEHQFTPLVEIMSEIGMSGQKIYNTVLTIENYFEVLSLENMADLGITNVEFTEYSNVDLLVQVFLHDGLNVVITSKLPNSVQLVNQIGTLFIKNLKAILK